MTITRIYIAINEDSEQYAAQSDFDFEVSYIMEFISKDVSKSKFKYEDVNKLIIRIDSDQDSVEHEPQFKLLQFNTAYPYLDFIKLNGSDRTEKLLELVDKAGQAYEATIPGVYQALHSSINSFRSGNYKNIWLFKKKRIPGVGEAKLICELDKEAFYLTLVVEHNGLELFKREILRTKPSSIIYHHKFKDILWDGDNITIIDRFDAPLFQILASEITSAH